VDIVVVIGFVLDWTIRIGALFIVPKNRKPSSATAWLMLILLLPFIGLLIFIILGSPKLNKKRRKMQKHMDDTIAKILKTEESRHHFSEIIVGENNDRYGSFIKLNENLSGFPAFSGNKIELISSYDGAIKSIAKDMKNANKFIHIEYFIIVMDDATEILFREMEMAVNRGVKVRVLFDAIGTKGYPNFKEMKQRLTGIGVEWHPMLPLRKPGKHFNRPDLRNHRKIVVIDGIHGYTGSQNLVTRNYHRKDDLYYDELVARIQGPVVAQLQAAFVTDWYSETEIVLNREKHPELEIELSYAGTTVAQILPSGPGFDNDNNLKLFTALIHAAKDKITIVNPYFVPEDSLITAITSAAQRDVEVIMINSKIMDQVLVGNAQRSYFEELLKAGVKIYQYDLPILLHSKYLTIDDDIAVIGSSNLDMRSFQLDLEVTLVAYDKEVVRELHKVDALYMKRCHQLHLTQWQKRSNKTKLLENIARLTSAVQ
jgi:cardiolipin synthase A/B